MFTGIVETMGEIKEILVAGSGRQFWISSPLSPELHLDQSLSHEGVCLTVDALKDGLHRVTAVEETLKKTNLAEWVRGQSVNLERCLPLNGRLDGHLVQGHVDATAVCTEIQAKEGSWIFRFHYPEKFAALVIEKGSICLNGISLTVFNVKKSRFDLTIIPYTFKHTSIQFIKKGSAVNLEFDIIGKYAQRYREIKGS